MSDWLVHSSGPWKKHKYKSRTGTPGNYKYNYDNTDHKGSDDERREDPNYDKKADDNLKRLDFAYRMAKKKGAGRKNVDGLDAAVRRDQKTREYGMGQLKNDVAKIRELAAKAEERNRSRKAAKQQAADEKAYRERMKEAFNLPTSGKSRAQKAQNTSASQRLAAQQAGKEWQEKQAKKRKEAARDKELRSGLNAEQKRRRNDAASKARKASEKRKNNERAAEQDRIRHIESIKKRDRKDAIVNAVRSFTKKKKRKH